jgi:hypothetical protein
MESIVCLSGKYSPWTSLVVQNHVHPKVVYVLLPSRLSVEVCHFAHSHLELSISPYLPPILVGLEDQ